jgi:hypothetical protein
VAPASLLDPDALETRAARDLAFIRSTMARSGRFTAVSGKGGVAIGLLGLATAWVAHRQTTAAAWLLSWLVAAALGAAIEGTLLVAKARRTNEPLLRGVGRQFLFSLAPAATVAALLTMPLFSAGQLELLSALWLLCYGAGVLSAGVFSVPAVPAMGLCFLMLGTASLLCPPGFGDVFLAGGFGGLDLLFGALIWRRHGG